MKVLHIVKTAFGATWVLEQVRVLLRFGIEVVVALPCWDRGLAPEYRRIGCEVMAADLDFPTRQPWRLPSILACCRRVVEGAKPDIIHTHHVGTTLVVRLALRRNSRIPRIFQVPGTLHLESEFFANLDRRLAGPRDYWIATCLWSRDKYLALGVDPSHVFLSYAGTDISRFANACSGKLRAQLNLPPGIPLVGMVAYMYPPKWLLGQDRGLKGHEDFFSAVSLARMKRPDLRAVVVGGPWDNANWYEERLRYRGRAACNGSLTFLGTRTDVPLLYPDLDLAVVPSHSENCGGAVEPLLSGVPVVATNVGGLPDLIREGETGWLAPPRDPAALARAILEALEDRDEARRRAWVGQKRAQGLFDSNRTAAEVSDIYVQILGRGARPRNYPALLSLSNHESAAAKSPFGRL